jgi:hypothetical protein
MENKETKVAPISVEQYNALLAKISKLENKEETIDTEKKKYVYISLVDNLPVVGWKDKLIETKDAKGEIINMIEVILSDGKTKIMEHLEFIRLTSKEKCEVLDVKSNIKKEYQGYTTKKYVEAYKTIDTRVRIPVVVESLEEIMVLERPNGDKIEINSMYVN